MRVMLVLVLAWLALVACDDESSLSIGERVKFRNIYFETVGSYSISELETECMLFAEAAPNVVEGVWYTAVRSRLEELYPPYIMTDADCRIGVRRLPGYVPGQMQKIQ